MFLLAKKHRLHATAAIAVATHPLGCGVFKETSSQNTATQLFKHFHRLYNQLELYATV